MRGHLYLWGATASSALAPAVITLAVMTAGLLGGEIVVETLFNAPGLVSELSQVVANHDVPLVQGLRLAFGAMALLILLTGDVAVRLLKRHLPAAAEATV